MWAGMALYPVIFPFLYSLIGPIIHSTQGGETLLRARHLINTSHQGIEGDIFYLHEAHWLVGVLGPSNGRRNYPHPHFYFYSYWSSSKFNFWAETGSRAYFDFCLGHCWLFSFIFSWDPSQFSVLGCQVTPSWKEHSFFFFSNLSQL